MNWEGGGKKFLYSGFYMEGNRRKGVKLERQKKPQSAAVLDRRQNGESLFSVILK
jgi:hypothetical protein